MNFKTYYAPMEINKDYLYYLDVNGMTGRHIRLPSAKRQDIVVIGGFLSSAEKHYGLLEYLRDFGRVNYIDLPGFGGMESLYVIDEEPSVDNYGNYLYSVFKTLKFNRNVVLITLGSSGKYVANLLNRHKNTAKWFKSIVYLPDIDEEVHSSNYAVAKSLFGSSILNLAARRTSLNYSVNKRFLGLDKDYDKSEDLSVDEKLLIKHLLGSNDAKTYVALSREKLSTKNDLPKTISRLSNFHNYELNTPYKNFKLYDKSTYKQLLDNNFNELI